MANESEFADQTRTTFTPGPWHFEGGANSHIFDGRVMAGEQCIAFVDGETVDHDDRQEVEFIPTADALLICAAPDLLALVEKVAACMFRPNDWDGAGWNVSSLTALRHEMRDVLAKAKGCSPTPDAGGSHE